MVFITFWNENCQGLALNLLTHIPMKKLLLLLFLLANLSPIFSQSIQNISLIPANPTDQDTVKVVADLAFTSGGCDLVGSGSALNGSAIEVVAKHCTGMLAVICYASDTISLGVLPAGNYSVNFNAEVGTYDVNGNCTGFVTGAQQSISLTVGSSTGVGQLTIAAPAIRYLSDKKKLILTGNFFDADLRIMDITGRILYKGQLPPGEVPMTQLPQSGLLIFTLKTTEGKEKSGRVVIQ